MDKTTDHWTKYRERVAATERFGTIRREDGSCLCTYCDRDDDKWHPQDHELVSNGGVYYGCLHCHSWTASQTGYCIHCDHDNYNQGETLVDGPKEMPSLDIFDPGTRLHTKVMLAKEAARVSGILFGPGTVHPNYMFRHSGGRWYPLGTDSQLAYRTMKVLADYFTDIGDRVANWVPEPTEIDRYWDAELARKHS